jgi:hypothetical protein
MSSLAPTAIQKGCGGNYSGLVLMLHDSTDVGKTLGPLFAQPEQLLKLGKNGWRAGFGKYTWKQFHANRSERSLSTKLKKSLQRLHLDGCFL